MQNAMAQIHGYKKSITFPTPWNKNKTMSSKCRPMYKWDKINKSRYDVLETSWLAWLAHHLFVINMSWNPGQPRSNSGQVVIHLLFGVRCTCALSRKLQGSPLNPVRMFKSGYQQTRGNIFMAEKVYYF